MLFCTSDPHACAHIAGQRSSCRAGSQQQITRRALRDTPTRRTRGPAGADEIHKKAPMAVGRLPDRRAVSIACLPVMLILNPVRAAHRGPPERPGRSLSSLRHHSHELERDAPAHQPPGSAFRSKTLPVPGHDRGLSRWRIPAVASVPRRCQQRRSGRPESDKAPPRMRWRGPARPRRAGWPVARPCRRSAPPARGQVPAQGTGLPAPPTFPGSPPRWCPCPNGESISTASAGAAQEPAASHFRFLHYPQSDPQKAGSYPHLAVVIHGLFTAYPQAS